MLTTKGKIIYNTLQHLKSKKIIKKIGVSIYDYKFLKKILKNYQIDLVQAPLNVLDKRLIETGWLKKLKKQKVEVHARSLFLQGILLLKSEKLPKKLNKLKNTWKKLEEWQKNNNKNPLEMNLSLVKKYKLIDGFIIGFDSTEQFIEFLKLKNITNKKLPEIKIKKPYLSNPLKWKKL